MRGYQSLGGAILICFVKGATCVVAAELAVQELALAGGTTADLIVNGAVAGEETFGTGTCGNFDINHHYSVFYCLSSGGGVEGALKGIWINQDL